jgi:hypothetical protein
MVTRLNENSFDFSSTEVTGSIVETSFLMESIDVVLRGQHHLAGLAWWALRRIRAA